jgi:hypothetical protein
MIFTFSEKISRRNGICDGRGWNSRRSGAGELRLCRNKNAWRSEGVRSSSLVDGGDLPDEASSSEVSESPTPRP